MPPIKARHCIESALDHAIEFLIHLIIHCSHNSIHKLRLLRYQEMDWAHRTAFFCAQVTNLSKTKQAAVRYPPNYITNSTPLSAHGSVMIY